MTRVSETRTRPTVSVLMVTYNSASVVRNALRSVERSAETAGITIETLVVDNASTDHTVAILRDECPAAEVLANTTNIGFAQANNQMFARASAPFLFLLNPDATVEPGALASLVEYLSSNPRAGAAAPTVATGWKGGPESAGMQPGVRSLIGHFFLVNHVLPGDWGGPWRGINLMRRRNARPTQVDWAGAGALLLRSDAIRDVGGFDSRFFLYGEDLDLGDRLREAGWTLWLVPEARAAHLLAGSQGRVSTRWVDALHGYYAGRAAPPATMLYDVVLSAGLTSRAVASRLNDRSPEGVIHARTMMSSARRSWTLTLGGLKGATRSTS